MKFLIAGCITAAMVVGAPAVAAAGTTTGFGALPPELAKVHKVPKVVKAGAAARLKQALLKPRFGSVKRMSARQRAALNAVRRQATARAPGRTRSVARKADSYIAYVASDWYRVGPDSVGDFVYQGKDWHQWWSSSVGYYYAAYEWSFVGGDGINDSFLWDDVEVFYIPSLGGYFGPYRY